MNKNTKKLLIILAVVLVAGICIFMNVFGSGIRAGNREMPEADGMSQELLKGQVIQQTFTNKTENIKEVGVVFSRLYFQDEEDKIYVAIELSCEGNILASKQILANDIPNEHRVYLDINSPISGYVGKELTLKIYETYGANTGVALMTSNKYKESYYFGTQKFDGTLCFSVIGD